MAGLRISPFAVLLFALVSVPLLEIYLLISIGALIGAGATIVVVILTAVLGAWMLRLQGLQTLARVRTAINNGELPALELIEGVILLVSGIVLLTPGFFTDAFGFIGLVPAIRRRVAAAIIRHFISAAQSRMHVHRAQGSIIEGTYRPEDPP